MLSRLPESPGSPPMRSVWRTVFLTGLACLTLPTAGWQLAAADEPAKQPDVRALIEQFAGGDGVDRARIVERLVAMGDKAVPDLVQRLDDKNRDVGYGCRDALHNIGAAAVPALVK